MWKDIQGYEGYYQVSDDGQVRSMDRTVYQRNGHKLSYKGHLMKLTETKGRYGHGYLVVNLRNGTKPHTVHVHYLVAKAFIPNPNNLPTVNHKDGNKKNNHVSNLEWMSYSDNNAHALRCGLRKPKRGVEIVQYDANGNYVATYLSLVEASNQTGLNMGSISHCINGIQERTCDGSTFKKLRKV